MRIEVEIKDKPKEGDIIIYRNGAFRLISGAKFLENVFANATEIARIKDKVNTVDHKVAVILGEED